MIWNLWLFFIYMHRKSNLMLEQSRVKPGSWTEIISLCLNCYKMKDCRQKNTSWKSLILVRSPLLCSVGFRSVSSSSSQVSSAWWRQMRGESELLPGVERSDFHLLSYTWAPLDDSALLCVYGERGKASIWIWTQTHAHEHRKRQAVSSACIIYEHLVWQPACCYLVA